MPSPVPQPLAATTIENLDGDLVQTTVQQVAFIDRNRDATIGASNPLDSLFVDFGSVRETTEQLGIDTSGAHITLSGVFEQDVEILYDGTSIGTVSTLDEIGMIVEFQPGTTSVQVEELLHALTYTSTSTASTIFERTIFITINSDADTYVADTTIRVAPASVVFLEKGVEAVTGTAADETFALSANALDVGDSLDGGGGADTLQLAGAGQYFDFRLFAELKNIDSVVGRTGDDSITLTAQQLSGISSIDGGIGPDEDLENDGIVVTGGSINLSGKAITNIEYMLFDLDSNSVVTFDNKDLALKTSGYSVGLKLVLTGDSFTPEEREQLHRQGFKFVQDGSGTDTDEPPQISGLNGDRLYVVPQKPVLLDHGRNAVLSDDSPFMRALTIEVVNGSNALDRVGLDTTGKVTRESTVITVSGTEIGYVAADTGSRLTISFYTEATPALVQELIRSLTYTSTGPTAAAREVKITLEDSVGNTTQATVTVVPDEKPTQVNFTGTAVNELAANGEQVGILSALDANPDDRVTFTLIDDAGGRFKLDASGTKVVVANGVKLDYEQASAHSITVRATDKAGQFTDQTFRIAVRDISTEITDGTGGDDRIVAGAGKDRLGGGLGNDTLNGGVGNDILTGGGGRDVFVFDSKLGKTNPANKKSNLDKIVDFSFTDDTIHLAKSIFSTIKKGALAKGAFHVGAAAHDASDRIIYNKNTGALLYDKDGTGAKQAVQFATLAGHPLKVSASDFFVF
ncbi:cadherin domain-containing protein [Microvirga yunnanensis]|uniref:cadherin domain-containing protein n=1 Tax=Microvirga yunnanensis TaxID=2953740 RepID=UPI0021C646EB|nr:cadherin domain-containing protein [Microvirga sp. HBU65207]